MVIVSIINCIGITEIINKSSIRAIPVDTITLGINTTGIGSEFTTNTSVRLTGNTIGISTLVYDNVSGLPTVTTNEDTMRLESTILLESVGTTDFYNKEFVVNQNVGLTTFVINVG